MQLSNERLVELVQNNIFLIDHMKRLYLQNKPLMVRIIKRMVGDANSDFINEMLQECYIILCDCVKSYDLKQDVKFNTYFGNHIRWGIYKYSLSTNTKINMPVNLRGKVIKYKRLLGAGETEQNIKQILKVTKSELETIKQIANSSVISLDTPVSGLDNVTVGECIQDKNSNFEDDVIQRCDDRVLYNLCRSVLKPLEFEVVKYTYWHNLTENEIGIKIGKSRGMVDQIKRSALRRLRQDQRINDYYEPYLYKHTGLTAFKNTHTSCVEKYVLLKMELENLRKAL